MPQEPVGSRWVSDTLLPREYLKAVMHLRQGRLQHYEGGSTYNQAVLCLRILGDLVKMQSLSVTWEEAESLAQQALK